MIVQYKVSWVPPPRMINTQSQGPLHNEHPLPESVALTNATFEPLPGSFAMTNAQTVPLPESIALTNANPDPMSTSTLSPVHGNRNFAVAVPFVPPTHMEEMPLNRGGGYKLGGHGEAISRGKANVPPQDFWIQRGC